MKEGTNHLSFFASTPTTPSTVVAQNPLKGLINEIQGLASGSDPDSEQSFTAVQKEVLKILANPKLTEIFNNVGKAEDEEESRHATLNQLLNQLQSQMNTCNDESLKSIINKAMVAMREAQLRILMTQIGTFKGSADITESNTAEKVLPILDQLLADAVPAHDKEKASIEDDKEDQKKAPINNTLKQMRLFMDTCQEPLKELIYKAIIVICEGQPASDGNLVDGEYIPPELHITTSDRYKFNIKELIDTLSNRNGDQVFWNPYLGKEIPFHHKDREAILRFATEKNLPLDTIDTNIRRSQQVRDDEAIAANIVLNADDVQSLGEGTFGLRNTFHWVLRMPQQNLAAIIIPLAAWPESMQPIIRSHILNQLPLEQSNILTGRAKTVLAQREARLLKLRADNGSGIIHLVCVLLILGSLVAATSTANNLAVQHDVSVAAAVIIGIGMFVLPTVILGGFMYYRDEKKKQEIAELRDLTHLASAITAALPSTLLLAQARRNDTESDRDMEIKTARNELTQPLLVNGP